MATKGHCYDMCFVFRRGAQCAPCGEQYTRYTDTVTAEA